MDGFDAMMWKNIAIEMSEELRHSSFCTTRDAPLDECDCYQRPLVDKFLKELHRVQII